MKMTSNVLLKCHSFICAQKYSWTAFFYFLLLLSCLSNTQPWIYVRLFHHQTSFALAIPHQLIWFLNSFVVEHFYTWIFFPFFMSSNYEGIVKRRRERNAILRLLNKFQSDFCSWHDWFAININIALKLSFLLNDLTQTKKVGLSLANGIF